MNMAVPESSLQGGDGDPAEGEFDYCSARQLHWELGGAGGRAQGENVDDNTAGDGDFLKNFFLRSDYDNDDDVDDVDDKLEDLVDIVKKVFL